MKWDVLTTAAFVALPLIIINEWPVQFIAPALLLLAYIGVFRGRMWRALLGSPWIYTIGGMCYTIYLWHPIVESVLSRVIITHPIGANFAFNWVLQEALMIVLIIPICAVLYLAFEKPFMKRNWPTEWLAFLRGRSLPAPVDALRVKT